MTAGLNIGDAIELKRGNKAYRTVVVDMQVSEGFITVYAPIEKGRVLLVSENERMEAVFVLLDPQKGKYDVFMFESIVTSREVQDKIPMLKLKAVTECKKIQRRDFYRLNIVKPLLIEKIEGEGSVEILTKDISAGGLMAVSPNQLKVDDDYLVYMNIFQESPIVLSSKVLSCEPYIEEKGRYLVRFYFTNIDKRVQSEMIKQINQLQSIELLRRKKSSQPYGGALRAHIDDELLDKFNIDEAFDRKLRYLLFVELSLVFIIIVLFVSASPSKGWLPFFGGEVYTGWNVDALKFNIFVSSVLFMLSGLGLTLERSHYQGRKPIAYSLVFFLGFSLISLLVLITIITSFI